MSSIIWNNLEIIVALLSLSGVAVYISFKNTSNKKYNNDLTGIIIENRKVQKRLIRQSDSSLFVNK